MIRPFELIANALDAWRIGDSTRAEAEFREGIEAYRRREPDGVAFALGRYGAFLRKEGRLDEAFTVLDEAVRLRTDIPAIWGDYLWILAERRKADAMISAVESVPSGLRGTVASWLMPHVRRALRSGDLDFAEQLSALVRDASRRDGASKGMWEATGEYGHVLEKKGQLAEAIEEWSTAFAAGSDDPVTANRLSMSLQRAKRIDEAAEVINEALRRGMPASAEQTLRTRLAKIQKSDVPGAARNQVPPFSTRAGEDAVRLVAQHRLKRPVRDLSVLGDIAYCLSTTKDSAVLTQIAIPNGAELAQRDQLPRFEQFRVSASGWAIGIHRNGRVGEGTTRLLFLNPQCDVHGTVELPDAVSEVVAGGDQWFVGCRDGRLYAFDLGGDLRWKWVTPGADQYEGSPYFRPCPYHVACSDELVVVSSMGDLFAIGHDGLVQWQREVPNRGPITTSVALGDAPSLERARKILGVGRDADGTEVKRAYRRLALATHPDRNPEDPEAAKRFREVQGAYEAMLSGGSGAAPGIRIEITMSIPTLVQSLAVTHAAVFIGSSDGVLAELDLAGRTRTRRLVGRYSASPILTPDGELAGVLSDRVISFFQGDEIVNAVEVDEHTLAAYWWQGELVIAERSALHVLDRLGRTVWSAEFPKRITDVSTGQYLVCAAGTLTVFERTLGHHS